MSQQVSSVSSRARGLSFLNLDGGSTSPSRLDTPTSQRARRARKGSRASSPPSSPGQLDISAQISDKEPRVQSSPLKSSRQKILDGIDQYRVPYPSSSSALGYVDRELPEPPTTLLTPPLASAAKSYPLRTDRLASLPDIVQSQSGVYSQDTLGDAPRLTSFSRRSRSKTSVNELDRSNDSVGRSNSGQNGAPRHDRLPATDHPGGLGILNLDRYSSMQAESEDDPARPRSGRPSSQTEKLDAVSAPSTAVTTNTAPAPPRSGRLSRLTYKKADSVSFAHQTRPTAEWNSAGSTSSLAVANLDTGAAGSTRAASHVQQSANEITADPTHPSANPSAPSAGNGAEHIEAGSSGHITPAPEDFSIDASTQNTSRAASLRSIQGGYHDRFSRQSNPSDRNSAASTNDQLSATSGITGQPRSSLEQLTDAPRGTLSDAAIVALGATPGNDPMSLLNGNGATLSSKNVLTIALQKAQSAVQLDSSNNVPEAIAAYRQAVRLLEEVMERIAPRTGKRSRPSREEERRRLLVIHNTYADRIKLLSMICSPESNAINGLHDDNFALQESDWLDRVRGNAQAVESVASSGVQSMNPAGSQAQQSSFLPITPLQNEFQPRFAGTVASAGSVDATTPRSDPRGGQHADQPFVPSSLPSPIIQTSPVRRARIINRPDSRDSRISRTSISMSIADEQEVRERVLGPPRIEEETTTPVNQADALAEHSADRQADIQSSSTPGRLRAATMRTNRGTGAVSEQDPPVTPYFDASAEGKTTQDSQYTSSQPASAVRRSKTSGNQRDRTDSNERPSKMGFAQRARALSFKGPLLRQKMSMPMLSSERRTGDLDSNDAAAAAAREARRPSSADSPPEDTMSSVRMQGPAAFEPTDVYGASRPRTSTTVAGNNLFSSSAINLGDPATASASVGQRRKLAGFNANGPPPLLRKSSDVSSEFRLLAKQSPAAVAFPARTDDNDSDRSLPTSPYGRARALSQPGSKRPTIPTSLAEAHGGASRPVSQVDTPPPVPDLARKLSALDLSVRTKHGNAETPATANGTGFSLPLPEPRDVAGTKVESAAPVLISDIFPGGLPSLAAGAPSYASVRVHDQTNRRQKVPVAPHALLRPYFVMQQLMLSIQQGAQLTDRLFVPQTLWMQAGVRLSAVETKIRAIELLASGIEAVERGGEALLLPLGSNAGSETSFASRFLRQLEDFEGLLVAVQSNLARKLSFLETRSNSSAGGSSTPSKGSKSLSTFSSRLTRIAGVGQAKSQDTTSITVYVETLAKLFRRASVLAAHTTSLLTAQAALPSATGQQASAHAALPIQLKTDIHAKLAKISDFFTRVILVFVLQDLGIMMDKYVKKGSTVFAD